MSKRLAGKIVVVTGGAGLLGRAFVHRISAEGGVAVCADIDLNAASEVAGMITSEGGSAVAMRIDITSSESVRNVVSRLMAEYGRVDGVVNNAYPRNEAYGRRLEDVTYEDFIENLGRHVGGYFLVAQQFAIAFRERRSGSIVNMGSIYGSMAPRFEVYAGTPMTMPVEYAAVKSGVLHITRYFAQYYKKDGVRINSLSPGGIADGQSEAFQTRYTEHAGAKGMLEPSDVSGALVFLLSDESRHMTGQNLIVDDGFSL